MCATGLRALDVREIGADALAPTADLRLAMTKELDGADLDARFPGWRARYVSFFGGLIGSGKGAVFVAFAAELPVGMGAVYRLTNHRSEIYEQPSGFVTHVYVKPAYRRRGVAAVITSRAVTWAKSHGCIVVRLRPSSMGKPVYESLGFRQTNELELDLGT